MEVSQVISAARFIVQTLGAGLTKRIYQNSIEEYLENINIPFTPRQDIPVIFLNQIMGFIRADLVVNDCLVVELSAIDSVSSNQCRTCMRLLKIKRGLIVNFPKCDDDALSFKNVSLT